MMVRRALARFRHGASILLLELAALAGFVAALAMAAPLLFILAAQFTRLGSTGDWRAVPLSEFFEFIRISAPAEATDQTGQAFGFILALPATLILFVAALGFWIFGRAMNRLKRRERERFHSSRQKALIGDIERAFEKSQT
jgi:hypothetical protein